jgi:hypothetical protein
MRIHLVTYATPRFRLRQLVLGWSAKLNRVADTVTHWTPEKLLSAGFEDRCKDIKLTERGSGFWAWKPFIIDAKLREIPEGDVVFYCDVGRAYPFKQLTNSITPFLDWMKNHSQSVFPGVHIPWKGPMSMWTKRDAYVLTQMDQPVVHSSIPIQASFSLWKACPFTIDVISEWMEMSSQRALISDDPSTCGHPELPDFHDHRHDQSLLTLCCLKHGIKGLDIGNAMPPIDTQHPSAVACHIFGAPCKSPHLAGRILSAVVEPLEIIEKKLRAKVSFGDPIPEPMHVSNNS